MTIEIDIQPHRKPLALVFVDDALLATTDDPILAFDLWRAAPELARINRGRGLAMKCGCRECNCIHSTEFGEICAACAEGKHAE